MIKNMSLEQQRKNLTNIFYVEKYNIEKSHYKTTSLNGDGFWCLLISSHLGSHDHLVT